MELPEINVQQGRFQNLQNAPPLTGNLVSALSLWIPTAKPSLSKCNAFVNLALGCYFCGTWHPSSVSPESPWSALELCCELEGYSCAVSSCATQQDCSPESEFTLRLGDLLKIHLISYLLSQIISYSIRGNIQENMSELPLLPQILSSSVGNTVLQTLLNSRQFELSLWQSCHEGWAGDGISQHMTRSDRHTTNIYGVGYTQLRQMG